MSLGRFFGLAALAVVGCEAAGAGSDPAGQGGSAATGGSAVAGSAGAAASGGSASGGAGGGGGFDASIEAGGGTFDPDASCAVAKEAAKVEKLPVDIIWVVDNSVSMKPAIDQVQSGINAFAASIGAKDLDYKVIMLSLRGTGMRNGKYAVCVPEGLAGPNCGNAARFFHSSIEVFSVQPLEQFLGTLGDTANYKVGQSRGPESTADADWRSELRPEATRTIVLVSDDNSRLTADQFEHFAGGKNWAANVSSTGVLPPGILDSSWNGLFDGYVFTAIYGWGSDTDPNVACSYPGDPPPLPPDPGNVYTALVQRTGGVRAKICDGAAAWAPFFDSVATAVESSAKINCTLDIPAPSTGTLDPRKVNVSVSTPASNEVLFKVGGAADCDLSGGWYYDDAQNPTQVVLCPTSCSQAQAAVQSQGEGSVDIYFGCESVVK